METKKVTYYFLDGPDIQTALLEFLAIRFPENDFREAQITCTQSWKFTVSQESANKKEL